MSRAAGRTTSPRWSRAARAASGWLAGDPALAHARAAAQTGGERRRSLTDDVGGRRCSASEVVSMVGSLRTPVRYRYLLSVLGCYAPLVGGLGAWVWQRGGMPGPLWPALIGAGLLWWTGFEYLLHRFVLHLPSDAAALQRALERLHWGHHREPRDAAKLTVPVYGSLPIAAALFGLFRLLAGSWEGAALAMIGAILGYLGYEVVHFRIHMGMRGGRWLRRLRAHHLYHHYANPERCFGVTTPLWDWACGTGR
jgi:sterol desaturase/sphingolipid hydroxylase (fatty acid hydroxylase superfamily)